ncbi:glycosyltransferase family 2 protein [Candidatus Peribacteria bacterium]|nr:glycosyltransferase family 2 protein [Candidatus Peribacteria bacterium]
MHSTPLLSIVIPAHGRPAILQRCLDHIREQTIADQIEVIVVNDAEKVNLNVGNLDVRVLDVPPCHQGVARNKGVEVARGKYVIFIGDDIFLAPHACEKHLGCHPERSEGPTAVLGFTTWDPALEITPVMHWLEKSGWQFGYPMIKQFSHQVIPTSIQHKFSYTSHISLPTEIAKKFPFREDVMLYGWEDVEWGWRLKEVGIPLFYEPDARAFHHHAMTMEESLERMETLGESAMEMERLVSKDSAAFQAAEIVPRGWKLFKYRIASMLPGMRGAHAKAFLTGLDAK